MTVASRTVSLEPFQRRFVEMEAAAREAGGPYPKDAAKTIALRLGWFDRGVPDGTRVRRTLGLRPDASTVSHGRYYPPVPRQRAQHDMARRLCEAMDLDPVEVGL